MTTSMVSRGANTRESWSGDALVEAFDFATRWLDLNRDRVNALNVFPIPDGDTGTNMALTMHASTDAASAAADSAGAGDVAGKLAYGALMGARGNSGVILSQIFRGFAARITDRDIIDGQDLAKALDGAREMAYKAVMRPVEGTMLTVIRVAADHAQAASKHTSSLAEVLKAALDGAEKALAETPDLLDILRQANVVDAGGQGVVHILDGLYRYALGDITIDASSSSDQIGAEMSFLDDVAKMHGEDAFGYCTNFMVFGEGIDFDRVRAEIAGMGQSAVVVGDDTVLKVHIHTENPGSMLEYALKLGYLDQIKIDNMTLQTEALTDQREKAKQESSTEPPSISVTSIDGDTAIIAVAAGEGLAAALRSMGADHIVQGGQTMNPSTEELLKAVRELPVDKVIILPNNKNIVMTANQVVDLAEKEVRVIPSKSVPAGITALAAFNRESTLDDNASTMTAAMEDVQAVEITEAVRDVEINGVNVVQGNLIGLVNGKLVASGEQLVDVASRALETLTDNDPELLTVFVGEEATENGTDVIQACIDEAFPEAEVEIVPGNQPHYQYIIAVE